MITYFTFKDKNSHKFKNYNYVLFNVSQVTEDKITGKGLFSGSEKYNISFMDILNSLDSIKENKDIKGIVIALDQVDLSSAKIEELNKNLSIYNDGKPHKPIYKVRIYEKGSGRFALGEKGRKYKKYVQGASNLYFGIYQGAKRSFATIPLNEVIERQKQGLPSVPEYNEKGDLLLFSLSPNDLVYVPIEGEIIENIDFRNLSKEQKERIYNVNDFSSTCYFTPNRIAKAIFPKEVDLQRKGDKLSGSYDTKTASLEGIQIKEVCIKLKVDRLGNLSKA